MMQKHYENNLQYLYDELKRIDLLIHIYIQGQRTQRRSSTSEEYMGLFISEEEIDLIIKGSNDKNTNPSVVKESESQRLKDCLHELQNNINRKKAESLKKGVFFPLDHLGRLFRLTPFEIDCLLICLAPELNLKYERLYAYIHNDVTKKRPTADLMLKLLCPSFEESTKAREFFSSGAPLFKYNLVGFPDERDSARLLSSPLAIDGRVVDFLLGFQRIDSRIETFTSVVRPRSRLNDVIVPQDLKKRLTGLLSRVRGGKEGDKGFAPLLKSIFYFNGPYDNGQKECAEALCGELGLSLLEIDAGCMQDEKTPVELSMSLVFREALLQSSAIFFKGFDRLIEKEKGHLGKIFLDAAREFYGPVFLEGETCWEEAAGSCPNFFKLEFPVPTSSTRKNLWESSLNGRPVRHGIDINLLADKFRFTGGQIRGAIQTATNLSIMRGPARPSITLEDLYKGCRAVSNQRLASLSTKIKPGYGWKDIVLPGDKLSQLKDVCNYVRHRQVVYEQWGFDSKLTLGKGLNALFYGPSGTGKTMAAEVIAKDLCLALYKIDLSSVVSKYIGETEKNLSRIFKEAETSNSILFFDEADALFGKRSEVKDAHDRYANIEVGYLLQKMEEYEGIVILATNLMKNMDDAFVRRMHFTVEFPFPDEAHRLRIWKGMFPEDAPVSSEIDFEFLARKFKVAGGNIKNIVLSAAFLAAANSGRIDMEHVVRAAKREFQKMGKLFIQSDFGKYYGMVL